MKNPTSRLPVNGETTLTLFVRRFSVHMLGYISDYLALKKIAKHVPLFRHFICFADDWILHRKVYYKPVLNRKIFVKSPFLRGRILWKSHFWGENILWRVCISDVNLSEGSVNRPRFTPGLAPYSINLNI